MGWPGGVGRCLRDLVLSCTAIDGRGRIHKAGARVVKNVAGYDLVRLHHGAGGSFGIVLDLVVRLRARAPQQRLVWRALPIRQLGAAWSEAISVPTCSAWFLDEGAAETSGLEEKSGMLFLEEGSPEALDRWQRRVPGEPCHVPLGHLRDLGWSRSGEASVLRWLVPPSALIELWPAARRALQSQGHQIAMVIELPSGHGRIVLSDTPHARSLELLRELGERSACRGGGLWIDRWGGGPRPAGSSGDIDPRARRLRSAFDPHGLLPPLPQALRLERS
jgi:glycolate oxidase FAD binding subunit